MYGHELKVWGEDLLPASEINKASVTADDAVIVNGAMGALTANVIAVGAVSLASAVTVSIKAADEKDGSFNEVATGTIATGSYEDGEVLGTIAIPYDVKKWAKASLASATGNSGKIRVTPGYLPR